MLLQRDVIAAFARCDGAGEKSEIRALVADEQSLHRQHDLI